MFLLEQIAKNIVKEETATDMANKMKKQGYKYVVHGDESSGEADMEFAKDTKGVSDVLDKNKGKNLTVSTIESYVRKKATSIKEAKDDWKDKAVKRSGKLRADLGVKKGEKVYEIGVDKMVDYAKKSETNADRVRLAWAMSKRRGTTRSQRETKFWASVAEKMGWGDKKESRKIIAENK